MKLKTVEIDGKTYAEVQDGKPVFTGDDGKDIAFDAVGTRDTISRLNAEAKGHREAKEAAEKLLKGFDGLDAAAARKAVEDIGKLDAKKLIDAGEVDKVKAEISKAYDEQIKARDDKIATLEGSLRGEKIGGAFARSKFIADKAAIPADLMEARFGSNFKLVDGKVIAYDQAGNQIYSKAKPGEPADFEEALEMLVDAYAYKDNILKGKIGAGGGTGQPGHVPAGKTMSLADFNALDAKTRAAKMAEQGFQLTE